jgi:hypothetical protein
MRRPRMTRPGRAALAAAGLLLLVTVPVAMAARGRDTPPSPPGQTVPVPAGESKLVPGADSRGQNAGPADSGYWTEERMRQAPGATMPEDR